MSGNRYYYGAKRDTHDHRDFKKVYPSAKFPSHHHPNADLRKYVHHIYDQKNLGSCTANAVCGAYGLDLTKQSKLLGEEGHYSYFDSSRLFLYYNTREYGATTTEDSGASLRDTVKALCRRGVCKESVWPYDVSKFTQKPHHHCYIAAQGNTIKYKRLNQEVDQFRACLKDNCPFVFGFQVYESFQAIDQSGDMPMPTPDELKKGPVGAQAVIAVGYDDENQCIIVQNSWGAGWGDKGYFYMPYDLIKDPDFCYDFWKISFACKRGVTETQNGPHQVPKVLAHRAPEVAPPKLQQVQKIDMDLLFFVTVVTLCVSIYNLIFK